MVDFDCGKCLKKSSSRIPSWKVEIKMYIRYCKIKYGEHIVKHMVQKYLNLGFGSISSIIWRCMYANINLSPSTCVIVPNPWKSEPTGLPHGRVEALLPQRMASMESHHLRNTLTYLMRPQWKALTSKNIFFHHIPLGSQKLMAQIPKARLLKKGPYKPICRQPVTSTFKLL